MTHLDLARVEERETKKREEPAKQWRNKWRVIDPDFLHGPNEIVFSKAVFPTKEVAEEKARLAMDDNAYLARARGLTPPEYLGAFPVSP